MSDITGSVADSGFTAYIAGPMTGYPEFNRHAFDEAEDLLKTTTGYTVINPISLDFEGGLDCTGKSGYELRSREEMLVIIKRDLDAILGCQMMLMLEGWEKSTGARAEHAVAVWLGIAIVYQ